MSADRLRKDLILLVADKNMEASLRGLLSRFQSRRFRQVAFDLYVHPERDPGCLLRAHDFLRPSQANTIARWSCSIMLDAARRRRSDPGWNSISRSGLLIPAGKDARPPS